jgi:hypothetical protein
MIGHEHVRVNRTVKPTGMFRDEIQVQRVVTIRKETRRPVVSSLNEMNRAAG